MHNKGWRYVRAVMLTTLTMIGTASLSVLTNIKILAQTPSEESLEQQKLPIIPINKFNTFNIRHVVTDFLTEKPPIICRILAIRNILSWKCPVQRQGNSSVQTPANIPQ